MALWGKLHLNIRQKVMVGLTACILAIGFIGGLSYHYLAQIETKQRFVEIADDLSNTILEIRRYEKNYLLYGSVYDLEENRRYLQLGLETLDKIAPEVKSLKIAPQFPRFQEEFLAYGRLMEELPQSGGSRSRVGEQLRERGKTLVDLSLHLVRFERQRILEIINTLKTQLFTSMAVFLGFMGFFVFIVSRKIIRPLRVIEDTTLRITQGNFRPLPVLDTRDETQRVVEAFNRMVVEL